MKPSLPERLDKTTLLYLGVAGGLLLLRQVKTFSLGELKLEMIEKLRERQQKQEEKMKAWRVHAWGEPETMKLEEVAPPEPAPNQVRGTPAACSSARPRTWTSKPHASPTTASRMRPVHVVSSEA